MNFTNRDNYNEFITNRKILRNAFGSYFQVPMTKNVHLFLPTGVLKKNKTIFKNHTFFRKCYQYSIFRCVYCMNIISGHSV